MLLGTFCTTNQEPENVASFVAQSDGQVAVETEGVALSILSCEHTGSALKMLSTNSMLRQFPLACFMFEKYV